MARRKSRNRSRNWIGRIFGGLGCLTVLAVLGVGVFFGYQQIRQLLQPTYNPGGDVVATEDRVVERGNITEQLQVYGWTMPRKEASLGFQTARGKVTNVWVGPGQTVRAGDVLVELDAEALGRALAEAEADLLEAQTKLEDLSKPVSLVDRLKLESDLHQARLALEKARQDLETYDKGKDTPEAQRKRAAEELAAAKADLDALRNSRERKEQIDFLQWIYNIAEVEHGPMVLIPNPSEQDRDKEWLDRLQMLDKLDALNAAKLQYQVDLRAAQRKVAQAEQKVAGLDREIAAGKSEMERQKLSSAITLAEARVRQLEVRLLALDKAANAVDIARAQADVLKKQWLVDDAQAALADAKLIAPFDGVIDQQLSVAPDMVINSSLPVVHLLDNTAMYVVAKISDIDIARLTPGQVVNVSLDAFYGQGQEPLAGTLGEIPLYGKYENGLTVFDVPVEVEFTPDMPVWAGMSVNLGVPVEEKQDVLLIPLMAVRYDMEGSYVTVVRGDKTERQSVTLGVNDGINVEVLKGLEEGDVVRVPLQGPVGPGRGIFLG